MQLSVLVEDGVIRRVFEDVDAFVRTSDFDVYSLGSVGPFDRSGDVGAGPRRVADGVEALEREAEETAKQEAAEAQTARAARVAQAALERKLAAEVARATAAEGETRKLDERLPPTLRGDGEKGPLERRLDELGTAFGIAFGSFGELSPGLEELLIEGGKGLP